MADEQWSPVLSCRTGNSKAESLGGEAAIVAARMILSTHGIIAVKGLGGFHLVCNAQSSLAIARLRQIKARPDKPLAVMFRDIETLQRECQISDLAISLLASPMKPVVILERHTASTLPRLLAPGLDTIGVILPYAPLHPLLFSQDLDALVATSANRSGEPTIFEDAKAHDRLGPYVDGVLTHGQEIVQPLDDSVLYCMAHINPGNKKSEGQLESEPILIRRSRGYVPSPLSLAQPLGQVIMGCGSDVKASFCLGQGKLAFPSPYLGNLENPETLDRYRSTLARYQEFLHLEPTVVAHDLNPAHISSQIIAATDLAGQTKIPIQHHHAHIAACMGENGISGPVIGIAYDGSGYGLDGKVWGGEILYCTPRDFQRLAHWENVPLPGNSRAIREPWRMALSYLKASFVESSQEHHPVQLSLANLPGATRKKATQLLDLWDRLEASWLTTSSMGRLFDGVAALLGLCFESSYTGQAAILLENAAWQFVRARGFDVISPYQVDRIAPSDTNSYGNGHPPISIPLTSLIQSIVHEQVRGMSIGEIAARFHRTIAQTTAEMARFFCQELRISTVALSGGVWQNQLLCHWTRMLLRQVGLDVIWHRQLSPGDECIGFGQVIIAGAKLQEGGVWGVPCCSSQGGYHQR